VWWEAFHTEPKKVSDLAQFCEERDLMLAVRGDGSSRSQQTRLGKALTMKRDRVFHRLTVKRINQGERKHGVLYALALATDGNQPDSTTPDRPDLLDFSEGNLGAEKGNLGEKGSPLLGPIDSITCEESGNLGNLGNLFPSPREENSLSHSYTHMCESGAHVKRTPEKVSQVHKVPLKPVTETKDSTSFRGTSGAEVPLRFPRGSPADGPTGIDLAMLPKTVGTEPP